MAFAYKALVGILATGISMSIWQALADGPYNGASGLDMLVWRLAIVAMVFGILIVAVLGYFRGTNAIDRLRDDINAKHVVNTHNLGVMFEAVENTLRALFREDNRAQQEITQSFTEFKKRLK